MHKIKTLLIVATSGRMLSYATKKANYPFVVIDCFADMDTQAMALDCIKVESLAIEHLSSAYLHLKNRHPLTHVIYGSGFERQLSSLEFLQQDLIVLGNELSVFSAAQNKTHFFSRLTDLHIPFPESCFQAPPNSDGWLVKPLHGEGGSGIKKYNNLLKNNDDYCYWQKYIDGTPLSVLFIANGLDYKLCGFHKQWITTDADNDFIFSGLLSQPDISNALRLRAKDWVTRLVKEFSLKGLNSLDFVFSKNKCYVLEINARPSASLLLYEEDLLTPHIMSFFDLVLAPIYSIPTTYRAYKIIFAENDCLCSIKDTINWPSWAADIPQPGSFIHTGKPICSIIANGKNEQHVLNELLEKQQIINKLIQ